MVWNKYPNTVLGDVRRIYEARVDSNHGHLQLCGKGGRGDLALARPMAFDQTVARGGVPG